MDTPVAEQPDRPDGFAPLQPDPLSGSERRVGVEIEFAGLAPDVATCLLTDRFGGSPDRNAPGDRTIRDTAIGKIELYLDSAYRPGTDSAAARMGVELAQSVVPLEIVTEPLAHTDLPEIEALIAEIGSAGGHGGKDSLLIGCGLHLNIDLADSKEGADMPRIALAYALLERWLRRRDPPDMSRRLLPFVDPFSADLVTALAEAGPALERDALFDLLSRHRVGRNQGLDLLPAWASVAPKRFATDGPQDSAVSARPAYHYRLPNCRIGDPGWSLAYEWNRWRLVEIVARRRGLLSALCEHWLTLRSAPLFPERSAWQDAVSASLGPLAALAPAIGPADGAR